MKRKIAAMHEAYSIDTAHTCKDCCNFRRIRYHDKILRKCEAYGLTHSAASDWAGSWIACGLFNKPFPDGRPLIRLLMGSRRTLETGPLDGQCGWEDLAAECETNGTGK